MFQVVIDFVLELLGRGLGKLASYLAAHVLLCLLPAFLIAGAMAALIPKETITRYLGRNQTKLVTYPAAAVAGFLLAVCSCTVIPLFAGIYKKGAGLGPAITFLFVAPAVNILAITYTGKMLGMDLAVARLILSLAFGVGIGVLMASIFHRDDLKHDQASDALFAGQASMRGATMSFILLLLALLVVGTFQFALLQQACFRIDLPLLGMGHFQGYLDGLVPFDPAKGEEGITVQGVVMIGMLGLIGLAAWKGIEKASDSFNRCTWVTLGLIGVTLLVATLGMEAHSGGLTLLVTGRSLTVAGIIVLLGWVIRTQLEENELRSFLWESWRFVKQIFPLLVIGVFVVGMVQGLIQPRWIEALAGRNSVSANLVGVVFGVFMYFPTLVEVPIAQMFGELGMHRGPLLAYLIADPELSLQSILITASIIGRRMALAYVGFIAVFSTASGLLYGAWVNGASLWLVGSYLGLILALLAVVLGLLNRRNNAKSEVCPP